MGRKKIPLCNIITKSYQNGELSTSQRQAVIKLIENRIRTINKLKLGDQFFLLNVDTKLISKVLAEKLKNVLLSLTSKN